MLRRLHSIPGLTVALLAVVLAVTGTALALVPALEQAGVASTGSGTSVADLAAAVSANVPGVEQIVRKASGAVIAYSFDNGVAGADLIDPATGAVIGVYESSAFADWLTNLHRSLLSGDTGRMIVGAGAGLMLVLSLSGFWLMVRRMGGIRQVFAPAKGSLSQKLHLDVGRITLAGLFVSSLTGLYMSLATFGVIGSGGSVAAFPDTVDGGTPAAISELSALQAVDVTQLRELVFPWDALDVFTLRTADGSGTVDQATGAMLTYAPNDVWARIYEAVFMLHTGQGLWWFGLVLGATALGLPLLSATGTLVWWSRQRGKPRIRHNVPVGRADAVILIGSEGNSTWAFGKSLHEELTAAGQKVHIAPMNAVAAAHVAAPRLFVLTATYGDGDAPASANRFLDRLAGLNPDHAPEVAVVGFGDRQFARYCAFAERVSAALAAKGWPVMVAQTNIDRQSLQAFAAWGEVLGARLGVPVNLRPVLPAQRQHELVLVDRTDYGDEVQAPTAVLRFALPKRAGLARLLDGGPRFAAGDLLGIVPAEGAAPRYYSLASGSRDGFVEICVRRHPSGLCSSLLHDLQPGDVVEGFFKTNPAFRPAKGKAPVVMIGAGTGIGPLAGFARANARRRPMHLYFGGRHPASDHLYERDLKAWLDDGRLTRLETAFSRHGKRTYVQDRLETDAEALRGLVLNGAQILVCGGRDMAEGVERALTRILAPLDLDPGALKQEGRYVADVY